MKKARWFSPPEEHVAGVRPGDAGYVYIKPSTDDRTEARETALHRAGEERGLVRR